MERQDGREGQPDFSAPKETASSGLWCVTELQKWEGPSGDGLNPWLKQGQ